MILARCGSWVVGSKGTADDPCMCVQARSMCQHKASSTAHSDSIDSAG
jgi:hypothetical protein